MNGKASHSRSARTQLPRGWSGWREFRFAVGLIACLTTGAQAQSGVLPKDLQAIAKQIQCEPVPNFYSKSGAVDPPYAYGVLDGDRASSAAFWCLRNADGSTRLVIVQAGRVVRDYEWPNTPDGMRIIEVPVLQLAEFSRIDDWDQAGASIVLRNKRAIYGESADGGIETTFVEVDGHWYFRVRH